MIQKSFNALAAICEKCGCSSFHYFNIKEINFLVKELLDDGWQCEKTLNDWKFYCHRCKIEEETIDV